MFGMAVGRGFKTIQPGNAQALRDWPKPTEKDHVVSYRLSANHFRAFIPNFLEIVQHFQDLTKKGMTVKE